MVKEAKPWLCFFFLIGFGLNASSQNKFFYSGTVIDQDTAEELPFATLTNADETVKVNADVNGDFTIETYTPLDSVRVFSLGYEAKKTLLMDQEVMKIGLTSSQIIDLGLVEIKEDFRTTTKINLQELMMVLVVRKYMQNPLGSAVFPVSVIGRDELESTNQFSMQDALNQIPGVKMDSRGYNGSRRLNLRGTLTRSPFGVRNVRINMNGFPLTSSDGSSALELMEPADVSELNIYKGPTGSYEMSGTGGVLALQLKNRKPNQAEVQLGVGEFGGELDVMRGYGAIGLGRNKFKGTLSGVYSQNSGYRTHESNYKAQLTFTGKYTVNQKRSYDVLAMLYDGSWDLPGHILLDSVKVDPTQSNDYSKEHDAHVERRRAYLGIGQSLVLSDRWSNDTKLFMHLTDKLNPYGTFFRFQGIKDEVANEFGGRTEFKYYPSKKNFYKWELKAGTQWQHFSTNITEYVNNLGEKGDLNYDNDTDITEGLVFSSASWRPNSKLNVTGQLGYNFMSLSNNLNDTLDYELKSSQKLLPRVGASYQIFNQFTTVKASYAEGIGYPSVFERVDTSNGLISESLDAEESKNVELSLKTQLVNQKLELNLNAYVAEVSKTITEDETAEGVSFFKNAGKSSQKGIEFLASYNGRIKKYDIAIYGSTALSDYQFENDTSDLKLRVAGIVPVSGSAGVKVIRNYLRIDFHGRYVGEVPTVVGEETTNGTDYLLLNSKIGYKFNTKSTLSYSVELGVNNLLDTTYTSFFRLNATGKIYNPMAGRNFYLGVKLNFN